MSNIPGNLLEIYKVSWSLQVRTFVVNISYNSCISESTRMWADAQRDGRPAEYRWRPLLNAESLADAHYYCAVQ